MIKIEAVTKAFRSRPVLDSLSLEIGAGDRVALIGSNGAGKTTLIRCLLGEYTFDGSISIDGLSPRNDRREVLSRIGFVPQLPPPLKMPVSELVRFAATLSGIDTAAIIGVMERLGLAYDEVRARPFVKLSGGQKQKILAAIALGRPSRLLILDEPTANLDPAARKALFDLLGERRSDPVIISSHRLEEVAGLVNRVIEIDRGRIVLDDRVADGGSAGAVASCVLRLSRPDPAFAAAIREWGFKEGRDRLEWCGEIAAADRLRFLGTLARYGSLLTSIDIESEPPGARLVAQGGAGK